MAGTIGAGGNGSLQLKGAGQLARSLKKAGVVRAGNKGKVPYAGVINYGWPGHNIKATYFANKAAKDTEPEWTALYSQAVEKIINRITTGDLSK